jgi:hypothetical protein
MLVKKNIKGLCPFAKFKPCRPECALFRQGIRYFEDSSKDPEPFEECAINAAVDNLEQMHNRVFTLQKEMGDTKNVMGYKVLLDMGLINKPEAESKVVKTLEASVDYTDGLKLIEDKKENESDGQDS